MRPRRSKRLLSLLAPVHLLLPSMILPSWLHAVWLSLNTPGSGQALRFVGLQNRWRVLANPGFHGASWPPNRIAA